MSETSGQPGAGPRAPRTSAARKADGSTRWGFLALAAAVGALVGAGLGGALMAIPSLQDLPTPLLLTLSGALAAVSAGVLMVSRTAQGRVDTPSAPAASSSTLAETASVVAHEIRNPLTSAVGRLDLMLDDPGLSAEQQKSLLTALRGVERAAALLTDFLAAPQEWRPGRTTFDREPVDLGLLMLEAMQEHEPRASERQVSMSVDVDGAVTVPGDSRQLHQLLDNLLSNAIKYNVVGGWVDIGIRSESHDGEAPDHVVLEVTNPGITLSPEDEALAFTRNFRGDGVEAATEGHGIGLAVVQSIVEGHRGTIVLNSDQVSQATKVRVTLPLSVNKSQPV